MSHTDSLQKSPTEAADNQPQPDPFMVELLRHITEAPEAREEKEEVKSPLETEDEPSAKKGVKPAPSLRPPRARFNRD